MEYSIQKRKKTTTNKWNDKTSNLTVLILHFNKSRFLSKIPLSNKYGPNPSIDVYFCWGSVYRFCSIQCVHVHFVYLQTQLSVWLSMHENKNCVIKYWLMHKHLRIPLNLVCGVQSINWNMPLVTVVVVLFVVSAICISFRVLICFGSPFASFCIAKKIHNRSFRTAAIGMCKSTSRLPPSPPSYPLRIVWVPVELKKHMYLCVCCKCWENEFSLCYFHCYWQPRCIVVWREKKTTSVYTWGLYEKNTSLWNNWAQNLYTLERAKYIVSGKTAHFTGRERWREHFFLSIHLLLSSCSINFIHSDGTAKCECTHNSNQFIHTHSYTHIHIIIAKMMTIQVDMFAFADSLSLNFSKCPLPQPHCDE